jgi:hypothetical protein
MTGSDGGIPWDLSIINFGQNWALPYFRPYKTLLDGSFNNFYWCFLNVLPFLRFGIFCQNPAIQIWAKLQFSIV